MQIELNITKNKVLWIQLGGFIGWIEKRIIFNTLLLVLNVEASYNRVTFSFLFFVKSGGVESRLRWKIFIHIVCRKLSLYIFTLDSSTNNAQIEINSKFKITQKIMELFKYWYDTQLTVAFSPEKPVFESNQKVFFFE